MALFARPSRAPLEYSRTLWMRLWVGAVMLFLYAPLIILVIFSFNDSKRNVVWRGFTTKYYEKALGNDQLVEALLNSLTIAALATVASLALGAYLTPDLMGGTDSQMIANVIERQFKKANDWPFGAALSFLLIYAMFILIALQSMRRKVPEAR